MLRNKPFSLIFSMVVDNCEPILVIMPARNEADSIQSVIGDIRQHFDGSILVVDDGSTDQTAQLARQAGAHILSLPFNLGAWGALQTGMRYASSHGFNTVITMDADGQHQADSIACLLQPLRKRCCDVVIGAFPQRGSLARHIAWAFFRYLSGVDQIDLTSGLRAYNAHAIRLLASQRATLLEYQDMGVLMLLDSHYLQIQEVPIQMCPRNNGHSRIFHSWWAVGGYMLHTAILCIAQTRRIRIRHTQQKYRTA